MTSNYFIIESIDFQGIAINRLDGGSIEVVPNEFNSTKAALKDIAAKAGIEIKDDWNTQYMGWFIIRQLRGGVSAKTQCRKECTEKASVENGGLLQIRNILQLIRAAREEQSLYASDKNAITTIFQSVPDRYSYSSILVKLTIIDSLYSTQMGRRYYGLDELARVLTSIHNGKSTSSLFCDLASGKITSEDKSFIGDGKELFKEHYGIGKDATEKGTAVSLISKYAYFETDGHFPIYDSIAREMYPKIWQYCGFPKSEMPTQSEMTSSIDGFIKAINLLMDKIGIDSLTYDDLDRLLWTTGKIIRGNLSLVLTMDEYIKLKDYGMLEGGNFDIKAADINKLSFLEEKPLLQAFFLLAKSIS